MLLPTLAVSVSFIALHAALIYFDSQFLRRKKASSDVKQTLEQQATQQFHAWRVGAVLNVLRITWVSIFVGCLFVAVLQSAQRQTVVLFHRQNEFATVPVYNLVGSGLGLMLTSALGSQRTKEWVEHSSWCRHDQLMDLVLNMMMAIYTVQGVYAMASVGSAEFNTFRGAVNASRLLCGTVHIYIYIIHTCTYYINYINI